MPSHLDVSVIIPTYDRAALLASTLPRLLAQELSGQTLEVLVVDDGSPTDDTARLVQALDSPLLRLLRRTRGGSSAARNQAIAEARGRILLFVDDDAFVGPHFVGRHLALHALAAPRVVAGGIIQVRAIPATIDESPGLRAYHRHPMPGGNASAPAGAVRAAGGYDPWFSAYGWQDQELGERLLQAGLRRAFAWGAPIYHYKPPAYDLDLRTQLARERDRGRMGARFYHKHPRTTVGMATKMGPAVQALIRMADRTFRIAALQARVESGDVDGHRVAPWRAALLRARVESQAGARELARIRGAVVEPSR
jgi:GT2 family glycosyltransferase